MPNLDMDRQIDEFMVYCHRKELRPKALQAMNRLFACLSAGAANR